MMKTRILPWLLAGLVLAGCNVLPTSPDQAITYHVLTDPGPVPTVPRSHAGTLLIREMETSTFYQANNLAFSREPGTRGQYQYALWSELPTRRLSWLIQGRLEAAKVFTTVAPLGDGVTGEYQLNTRLIDFYHDLSTPPGVALLLLEAELVRRDRAELISRRIFVTQQPVTGFDAEGAAQAMSRAANQVIDDMTAWLSDALPAEAPVK